MGVEGISQISFNSKVAFLQKTESLKKKMKYYSSEPVSPAPLKTNNPTTK